MIADVSHADVSHETFLKNHPLCQACGQSNSVAVLGDEPDQYCAVCVCCFQARKGGWVQKNAH